MRSSNQCLTTLSVRPYDDSEYTIQYKERRQVYIQNQIANTKKYWLFLSQWFSEYNQPYSTKNEGKYIYKTKLQTQRKKLAISISNIDIEWNQPISHLHHSHQVIKTCRTNGKYTNHHKHSKNNSYYLYSDNDNKQYRTNKTSTRKRTTERETCEPYNKTWMDQVIVNNTGKWWETKFRRKRATAIDRQWKRRLSRSQQPCELSMHQIFY